MDMMYYTKVFWGVNTVYDYVLPQGVSGVWILYVTLFYLRVYLTCYICTVCRPYIITNELLNYLY